MNGKTLEQQAVDLANDPERLKKRLKDFRDCLKIEYRKYFLGARFDRKRLRLIGNGYMIQWAVREYPWLREGVMNQQTNRGTCVLLRFERGEQDKLYLWDVSPLDALYMAQEEYNAGKLDALRGNLCDMTQGENYLEGYLETMEAMKNEWSN